MTKILRKSCRNKARFNLWRDQSGSSISHLLSCHKLKKEGVVRADCVGNLVSDCFWIDLRLLWLGFKFRRPLFYLSSSLWPGIPEESNLPHKENLFRITNFKISIPIELSAASNTPQLKMRIHQQHKRIERKIHSVPLILASWQRLVQCFWLRIEKRLKFSVAKQKKTLRSLRLNRLQLWKVFCVSVLCWRSFLSAPRGSTSIV